METKPPLIEHFKKVFSINKNPMIGNPIKKKKKYPNKKKNENQPASPVPRQYVIANPRRGTVGETIAAAISLNRSVFLTATSIRRLLQGALSTPQKRGSQRIQI